MLDSASERTETYEEVKEWPETYEIEIYKLQHKTNEKLERYVGCTKDFKTRRKCHKTKCNNPNTREYNYPVYKYIREHGGWNEWEMTCLATEYVENKEEQTNIENQYITLMNATLCKQKPGAWQRAGGKKAYKHDYDIKHGLLGNSQPCPCGGDFTKKHEREHKRAPMHTRYEEAIRTSSEYVPPPKKAKGTACPCGGSFTKINEPRHKRSLKHKRYEAALQPSLHQEASVTITTEEKQTN